jgi:DNA-binding transcriptional ArsR family regulator
MRRAPSRAILATAAPAFAALGDPTRLAIVAQLCADGPQSIVRLTLGAEVSRQAVTKHLDTLSRAGLVRSTREGRERIWQLQTVRVAEVGRCLDRISTEWDKAIGRLQAFVER